jgi:hypothetical protein
LELVRTTKGQSLLPQTQLKTPQILQVELEDGLSSKVEHETRNLIDKPKYELLNNVNALHSKIQYPKQMTNNITYYGDIDTNINNLINLN